MSTPLEALAEALRECRKYASGAEAPPEAILWCDPGGEFAPVLPALRARLPNLICLGDYDAATRTGPALWLRAAAERQVELVAWPEDEPAIVYLPAQSREILRGAEDCPADLAPLVWFAVAGTFFGQPKQTRDWTLRGFLAAQGSPIGLEISEDKATREALGRAVGRLFVEPIDTLKGRRLDASALDSLLVPDPVIDVLRWMDGTLTREADPKQFDAFASLATKQFSFDPRKKARQDAAACLARREKGWAKVWDRFEQFAAGYDGVVTLLRLEEPPSLVEGLDAYPRVNERGEDELRQALRALGGMTADKAAQTIRDLEKRHGWRRETVWAKRGRALLAQALEHLAIVADTAPLPAHDPNVLADGYLSEGWKADWAALRALDIARTGEDRAAVTTALRAVYLPWLEDGATSVQKLAMEGKLPLARPTKPPSPPAGAVLLFVDGLRFDLGHVLADLLSARSTTVKLSYQWSGYPTMTATCKPLASPAAGLLSAGSATELIPVFEGKPAQKPVLNKAIETAGWSLSESLLDVKPLWREVGRFDERGHVLGADLATQSRDLLHEVVEIIMGLAERGRRVRVVTDHGWLLMPGGLGHAPLVSGLVAAGGKGHRIATLKEGAPTTYPRLPWSWDEGIMLATPTGARAFYGGVEYAHGGISPQECILPVLDITAEAAAAEVAIHATWQRLRLKVEVTGGAGLMLDVRLGTDTSGESILLPKGPRPLDDFGQVGVLIPDDYVGSEICLVVHPHDAPQDVRARQTATVKG